MYAQSFFTTSVRGIGLSPTTSAKTAEGCIAFMKAAFGLRFVPVFYEFFFTFFFAAILFGSPPPQGTLVGSSIKPESASYQFLRGKNSLSIDFFTRAPRQARGGGVGFPGISLAVRGGFLVKPSSNERPCERGEWFSRGLADPQTQGIGRAESGPGAEAGRDGGAGRPAGAGGA